MKELDRATWIAAARRYVGWRRCGWVSLAAMLWPLPVMWFWDSNAVWVAGFTSFFLGLVGLVIAMMFLMDFPCPRCDHRFVMGSGNTFPTKFCKSCGLELSPRIYAKDKTETDR